MELAPDGGQELYKTPFVLLCNMPYCAHAQNISSFAQKYSYITKQILENYKLTTAHGDISI